MTLFVAALASLAYVSAVFILALLQAPLDVRVAVAGLYVLLGAIAHASVAALLQLEALTDRLQRRGAP